MASSGNFESLLSYRGIGISYLLESTTKLLTVCVLFFSLLILADDGEMCRIPQFDKSNAYAEGEGAAVDQLCKSDTISDKNCLVVSNDGDSLIYALLSGLQ